VANIDWFLASIIRNVYVNARPGEAPTSLNARQTGKDSYKFVLLRHSVDYKRGHDGQEEWKPIVNARGAPDKTWDARYETVSFHFYYDGVPIKMRAELHTEYFALSFFAELDCACEADQKRLNGRAVPDELSREFATIGEVCGRRWLEAQNGATKRV